ncbi:Dihydrofolate synthase @ Folylpolyglutamate synthase [hydrothermal vent metagenome]|uniref:Dihydrofolate synthase @ Folylpolyglutamate synthase n=1 Tax=hydrothermal vent metagenome TaxID=652676 RepID=A0A3B0XRD1_9ZZZZ
MIAGITVNTQKFSSLDQWLDWQQLLHPAEIELGLERVQQVWLALGALPLADTIITVAGTNGKGSSIAYLEAIYTAAGYKVGSFTSPHLHSYTERIRVNGEAVSEQKICHAFQRIDLAREEISLTYFEFATLAALDIFSSHSLDIVLLEVGLGGRLDAVNIIDAHAVLLTSIGIDHVDWLGATRELIGAEKAGVMRAGQVLVCADPSPPESVKIKAQQLNLSICLAEQDYLIQSSELAWSWIPNSVLYSETKPLHSLPFPIMRGAKQLHNSASVIAMVMRLYQQHPVPIDAIRIGLQAAKVVGRFEVIPGPVTWVFDVAHNIDSTQALADNLRDMSCSGTTRALFSVLQDKDMLNIMEVITDSIEQWFVCPIEAARGRSFETIESEFEALKLHNTNQNFQTTYLFRDINAALEAIVSESVVGDRVVVFGSFILVAKVMSLYQAVYFAK